MTDRHSSFSVSDGSGVSHHLEGSGSNWNAASGQGINVTIQNLQNEQERVQKKTFTNWMNTYLCQRVPPIKVEDLFEEVRDGIVLLSLLEVLSGERLLSGISKEMCCASQIPQIGNCQKKTPMEKGIKLSRPHHVANILTALNFLEKKKIKLVNINATSIADGKPSIVLGLIWTIILHFQIEETFKSVPNNEGATKQKTVLPKQGLLEWADSVLSKKYGLHIKDFGKSWTDGVAFNAMIHNIRPDLVDMDEIRRQQAQINLEHAFSTAENQLGIPRLLDPEDVNVEKPDEKSIMTYVAQFLKAYPDAGGASGTNIESGEKEKEAYNILMNWLKHEAKDILDTTLEPVTNRESEFMDYLGFKTELDRRGPLYLKLREKVLSGRALRVTQPDLEKLDVSWQEVDEQVKQWLQKLDSCLPGKLGKLGHWLYEAEKLLRKKEETTGSADDMATLYAQLAREHREFFVDLEKWIQFFAQIRRAGRYEGIMLHGPHFDHMSKRLEAVTLYSTVRLNRLDYTHKRYKLQAYLMMAEMKLAQWTFKYGNEDFVEDMLADYIDCIDRQHMCENFDRANAETKIMAEKYKTGGADKMEVTRIDHFLEEISGRWKRVSIEIKSVKSMLEEILMTWKRYRGCVDVLTIWLTKGEQVIKESLEAKEEFFKDLAYYEEKHKVINESANFLIDVLNEDTAAEVKLSLLDLNRRFKDLVEGFHSFHQNTIIGRARTEYEKGVTILKDWLGNCTGMLDQKIKCLHADLKDHLLELDKCNVEIQEAENNFKITTKLAQSLVKDSSQDDVTSMLKTLNSQKEVIVRLRKEVPERIRYLKAVLPNVESLETGILDLQKWLMDGEKLLKSHKLDGSPEETDKRLEIHKAFFTETTYQKSIIESKNKVFQKISGTKTKLKNVDFTPAEGLMHSTNERFQDVVTSAKEWERKLEALARSWRSLQQKQQKLEEWLDTAQNILDDSEDDPDSLIRKHKIFFDRTDYHLMSDCESNVNDILQQLNAPDRMLLSQTLGHLKERWEHVLHHAPIKLFKLEFAIPENKFEQFMEKAEISLQQQRDQIKSNQNVKEALAKHKQMFQEGNLIQSCEQWLDQMKNLGQQLLKLSRDEQSLDQRYWNHLDRWKKLRMIADDIFLQLKQLPKRWKEYSEKLSGCNRWVQNVECLLQSLSQEGLTSDEYKEALSKFQKEMRNINKYQEDLKLLGQILEELIKDAPDADSRRETERLIDMQERFKKLKSSIDSTLDMSGILSKGYEYRDSVNRKSSWLDDALKMALENPKIDSLEDARIYLQEHETLLNKLDAEKANIQVDIEAGRRLQRDINAPPFIQQSVAELNRKWKDITDLVKVKHEKLKRQVKDWEIYESEKTTLLKYMKRAESELEKSLETFSQESAQKDLQSRKEVQSTLKKFKIKLDEVTKLNKLLVEGASRERQAPLRGEITDIDRKLENISLRLNAKIIDLEAAIAKWSEYYRRLNNFCEWLNEKELKLQEVYENKHDSPEAQLQKAEGIASQVYENHITLENLEKDARGLTQNFRSRETAALKSKLASVRRQWESLCTLAKDKSTALSGNVVHWHKYQNLHDQLLPWVLKAEKYCATELPKCMSLEEAKDLYALHQAFLQECEESLPIFDQLSTEAGYLMDQLNMQQNLEAFQKRWGNILTSSEDRSQKVDKVSRAWSAYGQELQNFEETLEKFHSYLSNEPSINTYDVQALEHELTLSKAFSEEVRNHQPQLVSLTKQFEQIQCHVSPEGLKMLKSKHDSMRNNWNDINSAVLERQKMVVSALQHRKDFLTRVHDAEKWVKTKQKQLDTSNEIYSDEVADTQSTLKSMKNECKNQEKDFNSLQQELRELLAVLNNDEAAVLSERFNKLMQNYTQLQTKGGDRHELCDKWSNFSEAQKDIRNKMKSLQAQLSSPEIQEEDVTRLLHETENLHRSLQPWSQNASMLDNLMSAAEMAIKDRTSQRTLHFGSELKALMNLFDVVGASAKQKETLLSELTKLSSEFTSQKDELVNSLIDVQDKLMTAKVKKFSLEGLQDLISETEDIRDKLYLHNPKYEHLRELGRRIMASDPTKATVIQQQLGQMNSDWETVQTLLAEKQQLYSGTGNTWHQYSDSKQGVMRIVADMDPLIQQELTFTNQEDVKKSLNQCRNAEFELHANQTHLDHMNNKGVQLLEDLKNIPGFDRSGIECDLDDVNLKWETANTVIEDHKQNLEAQLVCWDQVQSGFEEAKTWVTSVVSKLDDSIKYFDDAVTVESRLTKFKDEAPYFEEVLTEVSEKLRDLKELNRNQSVPSLTSAQNNIKLQFEKAVSSAGELESLMTAFCNEQQSLQKAMSDEAEWMNQIKETLSICDTVTGNSDDLIEKYETCKNLQQELASHQHQITAIQSRISVMQKNYPSSDLSLLVKDCGVVTKKFESLAQRADRIQDSLLTQLEQRCTEAQQQQIRWLNGAKDKVAWCEDIAGDRFSVEAKLATIKDLVSNFQEGEKKRKEAISRLNDSKEALAKDKREELEASQKHLEKEWKNLMMSIQKTKNNLEESMKQWQKYDKHFEILSQWLKDTEATVRSEAVLKPDLSSKREQLKTLKALNQSIQSHHAEFEIMRDTSQQISLVSGDSRTVSYADQLVNRYQILTSSVMEQIERCDQNINDHDQYLSKHKAALEWLDKAKHDLEQCSSMAGDEDSLTTKLAIVQDLLIQKEHGVEHMNATFEASEILYPNTSNEGREGIRQEMRNLRSSWEGFCDSLNDTQRQLDSSRMLWMSFDENFEQLNKWIMDVEAHMDEPEMKATLQEKKAMLQQYKALYQEILSHQTMIDSINDKGTALSSSHVQSKLKCFNNKYSHLCSTAESWVKTVEDYVSEHQLYQDAYQQCLDWMNAARDKVTVYSEVSGDRQALQNRLDRLKDFLENLQDGESKIKSANEQGEQIVHHTSSQGKDNLKHELQSLNSDWKTLIAGTQDMQQGLLRSIEAVEKYDISCERLSLWLKETEAKLKDCELKATVPEKEIQVEMFKSLQQNIQSKQVQFSDLQNITAQVQSLDSRMASQTAQMTTKYDTLKNVAGDVIAKLENSLEEHNAFVENYNHCMEWMDYLMNRLRICGEPSGNKQDVEDHLLKLQELSAERDEGASHIHQTIESGEHLYPSTSSNGKDAIRQDIRNLRENWETLHDEISKIHQRLDLNLNQWSTYVENYEVFQKWLNDTEVNLKQDTHFQATLPEKKAQLQNYKVLHQDITSREHILDSLREKACALTQSFSSAEVIKLVGELKHKYENTCKKSKAMLDNLEQSAANHQDYQDAAQDFTDWLNIACERLEACADRSGDKLCLQGKKDRLKEYTTNLNKGHQKFKLTKELEAITAKNTSPQGREILQREIDHLQREWDDYLKLLQHTEASLDHTLDMWIDFESKYEQFAEWLKNMELKVKSHELRNTLQEKQEQVNKFKKQREEILIHQPQIDTFTYGAQNLMHTSLDVRLGTQVSQLTNKYQGLLSLVKDMIIKWERYVQEHQLYNSRMTDFKEWISVATQRIQQCTQPAQGHESLEEKRAIIQMLLSEKDHGHQKLSSALEVGEMLYPDTAAAGRKVVHEELHAAKQKWENLLSDISDVQRHVDLCLHQWSSYTDGRQQILRWLTETEATLRADVDLQNTLQEKRHQLQIHRNIFQEITSHHRLVDLAKEKAQHVLQNIESSEVSEFIINVSSRFETLKIDAENLLQKSEQHVTVNQQYHDSVQAAVDWLTLMKDRQTLCADTSGDRHAIQIKLNRLNELVSYMPEGAIKLETCEKCAQDTMETTGLKGRQSIQSEMNILHTGWEHYSTKLKSLQKNLEHALHCWEIYESSFQKMSNWLRSMEKQIKECHQKSTLEEKQEQVVKYLEIVEKIKGHQREFDRFTEEAQTLQHLTSESNIGNSVSQLTSQYQALLNSSKDLIRQCQQNVEDHKLYKIKLSDSAQWLENIRNKCSACTEDGGSRGELEDNLERVQNIIQNRDAGFAKLNQCMEIGERLYPNTAPEGREVIRQELRTLKHSCENMFDHLSTIQRKIEVSLVHWTSFDESYSQVERWLTQIQSQLEDQIVLRATLEEKKSQLHYYKVLQQDVLSYQSVVKSISDKAITLGQTSRDSELVRLISQVESKYKNLCAAVKERVSHYEIFVEEHQQYSNLYTSCIEWLHTVQEKLSACSDLSGDKNTIQSQIDKLQDILTTENETELKVKEVKELSEKILHHTAPQGKEIIIRDTDALTVKWEALVMALTEIKCNLEVCMNQWRQFENKHSHFASWLKELESQLRDIDLRATLREKQIQLDKLKSLQTEVTNHQSDLDSLNYAAKDLIQMSTDSQIISQVSQLTTKHQAASINIKELCHRWEEFILDHQNYIQIFDQCQAWLIQMKEKVACVSLPSGDRAIVENRHSQVLKLIHEKGECMHLLQVALDKLQIVLPNTSVPGRDNLRREMQAIQHEYDSLSAQLNDIKTSVDGVLAQWMVYDDSVQQLQRWLKDIDDHLIFDSVLQNTFQEKKLQLERVKVLLLNVSSQQSTIDSLNEKAQYLKQMSRDGNLSAQMTEMVNRYQKLVMRAKDLNEQCEHNVRDHQIYQNTFLEMSDWLVLAMEKLGTCSDIKGDTHTIEAELHKLGEIALMVEVGRNKLQETKQKGNITIQTTSANGQNFIQEELKLLTSDFDDFVSDLSDISNTFATLKEKWIKYEEFNEELSRWIKDTESNIKVDSDLKTSYDQKMAQLNSHRAVHDEVIQRQEAFDHLGEQAQFLISSDVRISTQLTQLTSRYATLVILSKDLLKRYEQTVQDHEHYNNAYSRSKAWLQEASERLSVYASTSGDRYAIKAQLEKLQEFFAIKEEGQIYLHMAMTWGEKTMATTSVEGKEVIRTELQQLQTEWDVIVSQMTDTKALLESCLVQWNDYSVSYDQVLKGLKDMEKSLRDTQPKPDLNEKKVELQRIKGIYQDIVSYEQLVESVTCQAADLAEKSPASWASVDTSQIQTRYISVKEQAKDLLARSEHNVAQHQDFHDSCHSFSSWLRTVIEKLTTCSDTYGEKSAIVDKIVRAKSLLANLSEGRQRLSHATKTGEAVLPSTSAAGQTKIRQELQAISKDFEEFHVQLVKALSDLETCLTRWDDFDESHLEFSNWLRETEVLLRTEIKYNATLEEKKQHWEDYQLHKEDVISHHSSLERVSEKAQALFKTNAEIKTSHAIAQLTTRYNGVIALAKDITSNLEAYYNNHKMCTDNHRLFNDWLGETKKRLQTINDDRGSKETVVDKITEVDEIQITIDQGHTILRAYLESCERTLPNTNQKGAHVIRNDVDTAKTNYENVLTQVSQVKRGLQGALGFWEDFDDLYQQTSGWMSVIEHKLGASADFKSDLPEKRSNLERYKALQGDILAHKIHLDKLEEKADQIKNGAPKARAAELRSRFAAILKNSRDVLLSAEEQVGSHEEYRKSYIDCLDWLTNTKHFLQHLADYSGDRKTLQGRLAQLKNVKAEFGQGKEMLNRMVNLGERLCHTTSSYGQEMVQKELQSVHEDWKLISSTVEDLESNLERGIANWKKLDNDQLEFTDWLERIEKKLKDYQEATSNVASKKAQLQECENLCDEILGHKTELNRIRDKGDEIAKKSSDVMVSNNIVQLSTRYQSLCSTAKNIVSKLRELVQDHKLYDESLDNATTWLDVMMTRVQACNNISGDWHILEKRIEDIKAVASSIDDGLQKVNYVCDQAEKILPYTSLVGKKLIEEQVTELTNDWEKLNSNIAECTSVLEDVQQRWYEYEQYYNSLVRWLADTENFLKATPKLCVLLTECKIQLDKYKMTLAEIENHGRLVNELANRVISIEAMCNTPGIADSLKEINSRYSSVSNRAKELVELLQTGYDEHQSFCEAKHGCETWLLNMSNRLLAHNRFNTSSMELTNRQIENHNLIQREIEEYRLTLDAVGRLGQGLILNNQSKPHLATQVEAQLTDLEENYLNIQLTAHQIGDRLAEILKKWKDYKEHLDITHDYLTNDFPEWVAAAEKNVPDTQREAQKQREVTQAQLEKLYSMKQELLNAAHQFENMDYTDMLVRTEDNVQSQETQFTEQVNSEMSTCISQAEEHLDQLKDVIRKWDSVERMRQELRHWLHSKQEELSNIENQASKVHPEAPGLDLEQLRAFRSEVRARAPAIEELQNHYRSVTHHNPSSIDPVVAAIQDDWEELLGQIDILIYDREYAKTRTEDLQSHHDTMDKYLEMYAEELDRIDRADNPVLNKSLQMQISSAKEQYLKKAQLQRNHFDNSWKQISEWLKGTEILLDSGRDGLDYETLESTLSEFTDYFTEASFCHDEIEKIMEQILPTLDINYRATMTQILKSVNQKYLCIVALSQKRQTTLKEKTVQWKNFQDDVAFLHDKMDTFEAKRTISDNSVDFVSLDAVKVFLESAKSFLEEVSAIKSMVDSVNDLARDLTQMGNPDSIILIDNHIGLVNQRLEQLISQREARVLYLESIREQWEDFMSVMSAAEILVQNTETKMTVIKPSTLNFVELCSQLDSLRETTEHLKQIEPLMAHLQSCHLTLQKMLPNNEGKVFTYEYCMELLERYDKLEKKVQEEILSVQQEVDYRDSFHSQVDKTIAWMSETLSVVQDSGLQLTHISDRFSRYRLIEQDISSRMDQVKMLETSLEVKYSTKLTEFPTNMQQKLSDLHSLEHLITTVIKEKLFDSQTKGESYKETLQTVNVWLQNADVQLHEDILNVHHTMDRQKTLLLTFEDFKTSLNHLHTQGENIVTYSHDPEEKILVQKALADINKQWLSLQNQAASRSQLLSNAAELLHAITDVTSSVQEWVEHAEAVLKMELVLKVTDRLQDQLKAHRKIHQNMDNIQDKVTALNGMIKQLAQICESQDSVARVGDLKQRIDIIQVKTGVRLPVLEDAFKKSEDYKKEVDELIRLHEQTRTQIIMKNTTGDHYKQLTVQWNLLEDAAQNKSRIEQIISQNSFTRQGQNVQDTTSSSDAATFTPADHLKSEMMLLEKTVQNLLQSLNLAVSEDEKYKAEIHCLETAITEARVHVENSTMAATMVGSLKQQMSEHNIQSKYRNLQAIHQKQEKYHQSVKDLADKIHMINIQLAQSPASLPNPLETQMREFEELLHIIIGIKDDISQVRAAGEQLLKCPESDAQNTIESTLTMLVDRYNNLRIMANHMHRQLEIMNKSQDSFSIREEFETAHTSLVKWLTETDTQLASLRHQSSVSLQTKVTKIKLIEDEVNTKCHCIEYLDQLAVCLMHKGDSQEAFQVQEKMQNFRTFYMRVLNEVINTQMVVEQTEDTTTTISDGNQYSQSAAGPVRELRHNPFEVEQMTAVKQSLTLLPKSHLINCTSDSSPSQDTLSPSRFLGSPVLIDGSSVQKSLSPHLLELSSVTAISESAISFISPQQRFSPSPNRNSQAVSNGEVILQQWEYFPRLAMEQDLKISQEDHDLVNFTSDIESMLFWLNEAEALQFTLQSLPSDIALIDIMVRKFKDFKNHLDSKTPSMLSINERSKEYLEANTADTKKIGGKLHEVKKRWQLVRAMTESIQNDLQELSNELQCKQTKVASLKETADQLLVSIDLPEILITRVKIYTIHEHMQQLISLIYSYIAVLEDMLQTTSNRETSPSSSNVNEIRSRGLTSYLARSPTSLYSGSPSVRTTPLLPRVMPPILHSGSQGRDNLKRESETAMTDFQQIKHHDRPALLMRVIQTALPIYLLFLLLFLLFSLIPACEDDYQCMFSNNLRHSIAPMLRYTDGAPPT